MLTPTLPTDRQPGRSAQPGADTAAAALDALLRDQMQQQPLMPAAPDPPPAMQRVPIMPLVPYAATQAPQRPTLALPPAPPAPDAPQQRDTRLGKGLAIGGTIGALLLAGTPAGAFAGGVAQGASQGVQDDEAWYEQQQREYQDALDAIAQQGYERDRTQAVETYRAGVDDFQYGRRRSDTLSDRRAAALAAQAQAERDAAQAAAEAEADAAEWQRRQEFSAGIDAQTDARRHGYNMREIALRSARGGSDQNDGSTSTPIRYHDPATVVRQIRQTLSAGGETRYRINHDTGQQEEYVAPLSARERESLTRQMREAEAQVRPSVMGLQRGLSERGISARGGADVLAKARAAGMITDEQLDAILTEAGY